MIAAAVDAQVDLQVSCNVDNGRDAVEQFRKSPVDVVILNVSLTVLDCPRTVKEIREINANVPILLFATAGMHGGEITLKALSAGANDFITKPPQTAGASLLEFLETQLLAAVRKWHGRASLRGINTDVLKRLKSRFENIQESVSQNSELQDSSQPKLSSAVHPAVGNPVSISQSGPMASMQKSPEIIVIGSSTGGPQALCSVLSAMSPSLNIPILIVQHMPPRFTRFLAERLASKSAFRVREAEHGDVIGSQSVLVAPGGVHMEVARRGGQNVVELNDKPPVNSCRPAVDVLFNSVVDIFGGQTLGVVLTGMGADGTAGCRRIKQAGGRVIVQDRDSCVVWGMPRSVEEAGLADVIAPLDDVAAHVQKAFVRSSSRIAKKVLAEA